MSGLYLFVTVIYILLCLVMLVLILSQEGKQQGLGAITGASQETYWSKIKGHTREGIIPRATIWLAVVYFALSLVISLGLPGSVCDSGFFSEKRKSDKIAFKTSDQKTS